MSIEGSESIISNNFYNPVFLQKDSTRQALKKVSMVAGAVLLASALAPCAFASVPLLAKITIMKSAGALGCFILAKLIPRGRDYLAREISQWFQSQPENAKAEAQQILNILKEKDLSRPFGLDIENYPNITSLPSVLQNCTRLNCGGCTSLRTLPELPVCTWLECDDCTSLETLPKLPVYRTLDCSGCTSLQTLPELPVCIELYCIGCTSLQTLPELPVCRTLDCSDCTSLQALPELPRCETLICSNCTSLRTLPELRNCHFLDCEFCPLLVNIPHHLNRQDMIPRDIRAQADVHSGDRDERTRDALRLLWQTRLNADQINRQFEDFIRYFDGLAHSERKDQAHLALRVPKRDEEVFGPLLDDIQFSIHGFMLEGKELIARLWNFISSLDLQEQPLAKEGIVTALSDSFAPTGDRVCNQGKTQRLCICVLQGRLRGVQIDDIEIPNHDLTTHLNFFFANEERRGMEPHQLREQARLYCDQNPLVARGEFLAQVEEYIRLRE